MRIVLFGNNNAAVDVATYLKAEGYEIVGLVLHPPKKAKRSDRLREICGLPDEHTFFGNALRKKESLLRIASLRPTVGVSVYFGHILHRELLDLFERGCVNLHPALLPFNKGAYPNVWSIVDGTPAGATLHMMDEGVDTGTIIDQRQIPVYDWDTGKSLYERLERNCVELFKEAWPTFAGGAFEVRRQTDGGSAHRKKDVAGIDEIDLARTYRAGDLINILRARTFSPHKGAYFISGGRKVYLSLSLEPEPGMESGDKENGNEK